MDSEGQQTQQTVSGDVKARVHGLQPKSYGRDRFLRSSESFSWHLSHEVIGSKQTASPAPGGGMSDSQVGQQVYVLSHITLIYCIEYSNVVYLV